MKKEQWKDIQEYKGLYQISDYGRVRRIKGHLCRKTRVLKLVLNTNGYPSIQLWANNKYTTNRIHTLVLATFVGPKPSKMECRHLDGNPTNNRLNNLKWGTRSENQKDAVKHGTKFQPDNRGCKNGNAKLTDTQVRQIKRLLLYKTHEQISQQFKVARKTIYDIDKNKTWRHI